MSNIYYDLIEIITVVSYGRDRTGLYDPLDQSMKWAPFERRRLLELCLEIARGLVLGDEDQVKDRVKTDSRLLQ